MTRVVVIGASLAGLRAAQAVRAAGHEGSLVVVGDERRPPYTRPPLSKQLLAGEQESEDCAFPGTDATTLPPFLNWLRVLNLAVPWGDLDLLVERQGAHLSVAVLRREGEFDVRAAT